MLKSAIKARLLNYEDEPQSTQMQHIATYTIDPCAQFHIQPVLQIHGAEAQARWKAARLSQNLPACFRFQSWPDDFWPYMRSRAAPPAKVSAPAAAYLSKFIMEKTPFDRGRFQ